MSAQVLSDVVPQNDICAPQELASRRMFAPRSGQPALSEANGFAEADVRAAQRTGTEW
jgi:hypothetical protein